MSRAQTGLALAGLTLTAAVLVTNCTPASIGFVVVTLLVLGATIANRAPILHRLPIVGAPTVEVVTTLEGRSDLTASIRRRPPVPLPDQMKELLGIDSEVGPLDARELHIQLGLKNDARFALHDVGITFMHPEGLLHEETDPYGEPVEHGRWMPPTSESLMHDDEGHLVFSDYWVWRGDLQPGSTLLYFKLRAPRARHWPVRIKISSPDLYSGVTEDETIVVTEVHADDLTSRDLLSYAIQDAEALMAQLGPGSATANDAILDVIVRLAVSVGDGREDLTKLIAAAPVNHSGAQTGWAYDKALMAAKIRAAYDARRRLS